MIPDSRAKLWAKKLPWPRIQFGVCRLARDTEWNSCHNEGAGSCWVKCRSIKVLFRTEASFLLWTNAISHIPNAFNHVNFPVKLTNWDVYQLGLHHLLLLWGWRLNGWDPLRFLERISYLSCNPLCAPFDSKNSVDKVEHVVTINSLCDWGWPTALSRGEKKF